MRPGSLEARAAAFATEQLKVCEGDVLSACETGPDVDHGRAALSTALADAFTVGFLAGQDHASDPRRVK